MRNIFADEIYSIMGSDEKVVFLSAESGFGVTERIEKDFPERCYNLGIAEQSLIGTAAGTVLRGLKPVVYTMAVFLTMRAFEQIRVDVAYQNLPILLGGVIPGLGYGNSGPTHNAIEDASIMRTLPNMTVVYPSCEVDVRAVVKQGLQLGKPCYIGLGRMNADYVPPYTESSVKIGQSIRVREGDDAAIIAYGATLPNAVAAADALGETGVHVRVINMHTIKPLDTVAVEQAVHDCGCILTVEEATVIGGLGGAVSEYLAEHDALCCRFKRLGIPDVYCEAPGTQKYMQQMYGIDADGIARAVQEIIR